MARLNIKAKNEALTHEDGQATPGLSAEKQLRRSVLSCLLWEDQFYEDGQTIADRIIENANKVDPQVLANLAVEARVDFNLRHVPMLLLEVLSKTGAGTHTSVVSRAIEMAMQRVDDMGELLAILWRQPNAKGKRKMIPHQMQDGLQRAFGKFTEYQLAKYDRDDAIKLRDVLRMVRPKPKDDAQSALWKRVKDRTLQTPDTWEVALSAGADKKETFTRLITEGKLGYFALLRNLRNMAQAGVDHDLVKTAILARRGGADRVLPFRYTAAARAAPMFERELDIALVAAIQELPPLDGTTAVLVDVSGSMFQDKLSAKSDLTRADAGATLGAIIPGSVRLFSFSHDLVECPPRKGMAGVDAILRSQPHGGTQLFDAVAKVNRDVPHDRIIVITDEQAFGYTHGSKLNAMPNPVCDRAYLINVGANKNGVGYGRWTHIDGFSEAVIRFIQEIERDDAL